MNIIYILISVCAVAAKNDCDTKVLQFKTDTTFTRETCLHEAPGRIVKWWNKQDKGWQDGHNITAFRCEKKAEALL